VANLVWKHAYNVKSTGTAELELVVERDGLGVLHRPSKSS
jgi:hypothetical protein